MSFEVPSNVISANKKWVLLNIVIIIIIITNQLPISHGQNLNRGKSPWAQLHLDAKQTILLDTFLLSTNEQDAISKYLVVVWLGVTFF